MFAYFAVAFAASDLRMQSHMREDPSLGAAVLPSGEIQLVDTPPVAPLQIGKPQQEAAADPAADAPAEDPPAADPPAADPPPAEPAAEPAPVPTPAPTLPPTREGLSDSEAYLRNVDGDKFLPTPIPTPPPTEMQSPNRHMKKWELHVPPRQHKSIPTPTLDDADGNVEKRTAEYNYNKSHEAEIDAQIKASLPPQEELTHMEARLKQAAEDEYFKLENLTLAEAASEVMLVMVGEPMRLLSDMESFLFELKNAIVGPPLQEVRVQVQNPDGSPGPLVTDEMAAGSEELKRVMALTAAQSQGKASGLKTLQEVQITKPTGETEYVVSVNGIMEYRPPTAHGAVRVVSVLLLLASAIVLGIGWRYGSAPGMYPYVEDCRL